MKGNMHIDWADVVARLALEVDDGEFFVGIFVGCAVWRAERVWEAGSEGGGDRWASTA